MECPLYFYREIRENCESLWSLFLLVRAVRVVRGSCFSTGVSPVILTAKYAKTANKKRSVPSRREAVSGRIFPHSGCRILRDVSPELKERKKGVSPVDFQGGNREPWRKKWPSVKGSVRCNFNREMRENCESLWSLFLLVRAVRAVRAVRVVRGSCFSTGVSVVILTAKCAKTAKVCEVCFSLFAPFALFALFAVHAFQPECPL